MKQSRKSQLTTSALLLAVAALAACQIATVAAATGKDRKPVVSTTYTLEHAVVDQSAVASHAGGIPADAWARKTAVEVQAFDPLGAPGSPASKRIWTANPVPSASAESGVSVRDPAQQVYAVRLVRGDGKGDVVRVYPACWVAPTDSVRLHLDERGEVASFDWISGASACSGSSKVIPNIETAAEVAQTLTLPRPLKPVGDGAAAAAKPATPKKRLKLRLSKSATATATDGSAPAAATEAAAAPVVELTDEEELGDVDREDDPAAAAENQSFLRKYWMYILPVVLMMVLGGPSEDPKAAGSGPKPVPAQRK
ncbi:hypothetical protein H9P43_002323 [Blastocladiella emersonii ATCC 22665]|nr:hypothetical protein H9P43_002323 [Blastocladiella emersonii ATCC 22665]